MEEIKKKKRVYTKIGDIYCMDLDNGEKRYLQYIGKDSNQMNTDVLRVFKKVYPADYVLDIEEVLSGEVDFYVHTVVSFGTKKGYWYKVGKSMDLGDTENIWFRCEGISMVSYSWYIWKINDKGNWKFFNKLTKKQEEMTSEGDVHPPVNIERMIKRGTFWDD